jgi:hypothetical protein
MAANFAKLPELLRRMDDGSHSAALPSISKLARSFAKRLL